jgi:hypothetical protein
VQPAHRQGANERQGAVGEAQLYGSTHAPSAPGPTIAPRIIQAQTGLIEQVKARHIATRCDGFYMLLAQRTHAFTVPLGGVQAFFCVAARALRVRASARVNTRAGRRRPRKRCVAQPASGPVSAPLKPRAWSVQPRPGSGLGRPDQAMRPRSRCGASSAVTCPQRPRSHKNGPLPVLVGHSVRHTPARCTDVNTKNRLA